MKIIRRISVLQTRNDWHGWMDTLRVFCCCSLISKWCLNKKQVKISGSQEQLNWKSESLDCLPIFAFLYCKGPKQKSINRGKRWSESLDRFDSVGSSTGKFLFLEREIRPEVSSTFRRLQKSVWPAEHFSSKHSTKVLTTIKLNKSN